MNSEYRRFYQGRRVLVTGGLGFIGSTLARALVGLGARVRAVDALLPDYGGDPFNLQDVRDAVEVHVVDLRDEPAMNLLVQGQELVFNLAGQVSHIDSMRNPVLDLEMNCRAHLTLLEACRRFNPDTKVVYAGTRQVYGRPERLPVDEGHLVRPTDVNGIHKAAGEQYHLVYNSAYGLRGCSLRLTNVYGPRQLIRHNRQGFIGWFVRLALEGREIELFGDGSQLRDLLYVDDAVDAFLRAGAADACNGQVFNVGGNEPVSLRELVALLIELAGSGTFRLVDWPHEKKTIDIGSFYADSSRLAAAAGWTPQVPLRDGLERTFAFYREHFAHYTRQGESPDATS